MKVVRGLAVDDRAPSQAPYPTLTQELFWFPGGEEGAMGHSEAVHFQ